MLEERESLSGGYTNVVRAQYVWSPVYVDALVERDRDPARNGSGSLSERLYVQQDANFNVTALVTAAGAVAERYVYDPFGNATVYDAGWNTALASSQYGWVYLHQGGRFDSRSGLYGFRNRDYSPTLGRWMQPDPIRYTAGDANLYRFVGNAPMGATDPSGQIKVTTLLKRDLELGGYQVQFHFELEKPAPADGYIVQKVTFDLDYTDNDGKRTHPPTKTYWEAWFVKGGQKAETGNAAFGGSTDEPASPPHHGSCGKISQTGEIKFFVKTKTGHLGDPGANPPVKPDPKTGFGGKNQEGQSGDVPSTRTEPAWWKNASDNGEAVGKESIKGVWSDPKVGPPYWSLDVTPQ